MEHETANVCVVWMASLLKDTTSGDKSLRDQTVDGRENLLAKRELSDSGCKLKTKKYRNVQKMHEKLWGTRDVIDRMRRKNSAGGISRRGDE